jgi:hypothetical protein
MLDHFTQRKKPMSIHLQKFVDRVRGFEARGAKDFTMSMTEAKDLHADITRLLIDLQNLREQAVTTQEDQVITVEMDGGKF